MKKILIVEDHAEIRRLIRMTLELEDVEIFEADNGARGLALAAQELPDVILLDVMMPGAVDGIDVCRRIKVDARLTHTKVVMLSARGTAADIQRGTEAGADGYLVKPFSPLELMHVVARLAFAEA